MDLTYVGVRVDFEPEVALDGSDRRLNWRKVVASVFLRCHVRLLSCRDDPPIVLFWDPRNALEPLGMAAANLRILGNE